jgi:hypothetical protein
MMIVTVAPGEYVLLSVDTLRGAARTSESAVSATKHAATKRFILRAGTDEYLKDAVFCTKA